MIPRERLTGQNLISPRQKVALLHFTFKFFKLRNMKVRTVNFWRTKPPTANLKPKLFNVLKDQRKRWRDAQRGLWNHIPRPRKRKSRTVLDSGFHALNSRYWIPNLCRGNLDSWFHSLVGFRIPNFPDSEIRITWGEYPSIQKNIYTYTRPYTLSFGNHSFRQKFPS